MALTDFAGKTAVITGGASGIGLATASALYGEGAHLVLADINEQGLRSAEEQLHKDHPDATGQIILHPTDVTSEEAVQSLMGAAVDATGHIDLVVTCAGIGKSGSIETFTGADMRRIMDINFMGTFYCVREALFTMRKQGTGHFVCLSSVAGKLGNPLLSGYCATKWAVRGFTSAIRAELADTDISITTVYPAWVDTPMVRQENNPAMSTTIQILLTPQQVASSILAAVKADQHDLTLVPNVDINAALQLYMTDQDKAEQKMGQVVLRMRDQYS